MKKSLFRSCLPWTLLSLLLLTPAAWGTLPPWVEVIISPAAENRQGEVLFKALIRFASGSDDGTWGWVLGWIVVSADGTWDEREESRSPKILSETRESYSRKIASLRENFRKPTELQGLSGPAKDLVEKYGFTQRDQVQEGLRKGKLSWTQNAVLAGAKSIAGPIAQKTVFGTTSYMGDGKEAIPCQFYSRGIALFRNHWAYRDAEGRSHSILGAVFNVDERFIRLMGGNAELSEEWETGEIDGICIVPEK